MNNLKEFDQQLALSLYESTEEFPVDLDDAWKWIGYKEKRNALDTLKSTFEEDLDYTCLGTKSNTSGRSSHSYKLTVDCFKQLGMISKTEKGKQVRQYFLQCEKIAKQVTNNINSELLNYLNNIQSELQQLTTRTIRLDKYEKGSIDSPGCAEILLDEDEDEMTAYEFVMSRGINVSLVNTISKRASQIQRAATQNEEINKISNRNILKLKYLKQAAITTLNLKPN